MASIITYDVPKEHVKLKESMFKLGYVDQIKGTNCSVIYFPNTTLLHQSKTPAEAREDIKSVCHELGIELERCVAIPWGPGWAVICGEPFNK